MRAISVIIPTLDEAGELPATLDSVAASLGPDVDVIVVDGGSRDGTDRIAASRARLISAPSGRGRQLAAGAVAARGELLVFLHADTWLSPGTERALAGVARDGRVVGGCFSVSLRGPSGERAIARLLAWAIGWRSRRLRTATGDQAIFAKRWAYERAGGFGPEELFEDVLFYRRLRRLGEVVTLDPPVRTSDRRWRRRGYARTIAQHLILRILHLLGTPAARLARLYRLRTDA